MTASSSHTRRSPSAAAEYPPEPWHLTANAFLSLWTVPVTELPRVPDSVEPVTFGSTAVVFTAWFDYLPSGQMSYHELLSAVAVRGGLTPTATITEIWVDSPASRAGGRNLWAIPKELADLDFTYGRGFTATASVGGSGSPPADGADGSVGGSVDSAHDGGADGADWIATAAFAPRPGLPARLPAHFAVRQESGDGPLTSAVRSTATPRAAGAAWNINPAGPLGYLAGRTPVVSARLADARIRFGV